MLLGDSGLKCEAIKRISHFDPCLYALFVVSCLHRTHSFCLAQKTNHTQLFIPNQKASVVYTISEAQKSLDKHLDAQ